MKALLVREGVAAERISVSGIGEARPDKPLVNEANRRVEVRYRDS